MDPGDRLRVVRRAGTALRSRPSIVVLAVVLATIVIAATVWPSPTAPRPPPTFQQVFDSGEDTDFDDFPDSFPGLALGATVAIRDRIVRFSYTGGFTANVTITVWFPYHGGKFPFFDAGGKAPAWVQGDLGAFIPGDWIELVGTKEVDPFYPSFEVLVWVLKGATETPSPPEISLANASHPGVQHAVEIAGTTRRMGIVHFAFLLTFEDFGIDTMRLETTSRGVYMEFLDRGDIGYLDPGDRVLVDGVNPGNFTLVAQDGWGDPVGSLSFVVP